MRVAQVLAGLGAGGAEKLVLHLSVWLQREGHEVEVVNIYPDTTLLPQFEGAGIRVHNLRLTPYLSQWYPGALARYLKRFRPDVVHCHNTAWLKSAVACRWTHTPCVFTLHSYHEAWLSQHCRRLKWAAAATDYVVGVAPGIDRLMVEILGVPPERALYIRNGVADIYQPEPPPPEWNATVSAAARVVGMVGRFDGKYKDQATLVRAFSQVSAKVEGVHLVFIGDGPGRAQVESLARKLGLESRVHFLGMRQDVPVLLHALDVFVLSSNVEGESLAILEAMSAQRPIVATDVGGNSILLDGGRCGILIPPRDPHALAEAILELLTNREKAQQLAHNARQRFLEHFTIDAMGRRYLEVYEQAIARQRGET
ncbi:MAG: glycosyl transferase family 1 [Armatimonadota bacterium]|nr:MAG: glycosyl transferase family 1 [Armatimonadota bacterium]